jgi:hypothetical protein
MSNHTFGPTFQEVDPGPIDMSNRIFEQIFQLGMKAACDGKDKNYNPYNVNTLPVAYNTWESGWSYYHAYPMDNPSNYGE